MITNTTEINKQDGLQALHKQSGFQSRRVQRDFAMDNLSSADLLNPGD